MAAPDQRRTPRPKKQGLAGLSREDFRRAVEDDMKGKLSPAEAESLRTDPELVGRWHSTLVQMKRSIESQIAAKRAETKADKQRLLIDGIPQSDPRFLQIDESFNRWYAGVSRFKHGVETTLVEANDVRNRVFDRISEILAIQERNKAFQLADLYREAIEAHRDHQCTDDCDEQGCPADEDLWSVLRRRT